jgi:hypothetical protein
MTKRWSSAVPAAPAKPRGSLAEEQMRQIQEVMRRCNDFVREAKVPAELVPALSTGRPELVCLAKPRDLKADEVKVLYDLIGVLAETNATVVRHAALMADVAGQLVADAHAFVNKAERLRAFGRWEEPVEDGDDD